MKAHHYADSRHVKLFKNGRNQAVRIPSDFRLQGDEAIMRREGNRLIIEAISPKSFAELFAGWKPLHDGLPDIPDLEPDPVDL
ncbi:MAG: AbrB/MazE/SpoVT family DNA-binding domain-containing protein [Gammaproteobacteria bacterium]|nr:AbrB/MazE/SpoVT family DNA-binding domain-containing protein [Gammaproteobacteria bacterium]